MDGPSVWVIEETARSLRGRLAEHMPSGAGRAMALWLLEPGNPLRGEYLQRMGVLQLIQLERSLLAGLVAPEDWPALVRGSAGLRAYLTCEVVSDNLALGLAADRVFETAGARTRRHVLRRFNAAAITRLRGPAKASAEGASNSSAAHTLAEARGECATISAFHQSLCEGSMRALATSFVAAHPGRYSSDEVEGSTYPYLVANIELAGDVARAASEASGGRLVRRGLIERYAAVDQLLAGESMLPNERATNGAHAILVAPTLARYLQILARIEPGASWEHVLSLPALAEALQLAALMVRLTNDLGALVLPGSGAREAVLEALPQRADVLEGGRRGLERALASVAARVPGDRLTRLVKDIEHGEYNVALDGYGSSYAEVIASFRDRVRGYAAVYGDAHARLDEHLAMLAGRGLPAHASSLIRRFVDFHERLYTRSYASSVGEYAV